MLERKIMLTLLVIILIFSSYANAVYNYTDTLCLSEHHHAYINGKYIHYNYSSIPGDEYYCNSCGAEGTYIYPLKFQLGSLYHWMIGPTLHSSTVYSYCRQFAGSRSLMYRYLINDCTKEWMTYSGSDWVADDITIDPCSDTTQNYTTSIATTTTTTTGTAMLGSTEPTEPTIPTINVSTTAAYYTYCYLDYDYINVSYVISDLSEQNLISWENSPTNTFSDVLRIIKLNYLYLLTNQIEADDFRFCIYNVNGHDFTQIRFRRGDNVTLNCQIKSWYHLDLLRTTSVIDPFRQAVRDDLRIYFNNNTKLNVSVEVRGYYVETVETSAPESVERIESYEIIVASICILAVGFIFSIVIKVSNSRKSSKTDNAKWMAPLFFSFQVYDFISDIYLSYEILWYAVYGYDKKTMFWLGIASVIFIVLPFVSNLFFGIFMSKQKIIRNNERAKTYFTNEMMIFIPLIVISAGCQPALMMVSSRIFDLDSMSCGLTKHELYKLLKIKVYSTIIFEDLPQLIIQIIYASETTTISSAVVMAFIASLLSIITTVSIYIAYKVSTKDAEIISYHLKFYNKNETPLTPRKKTKIVSRKGKTEELEKLIAEEFNISRMSMEIGYIKQISEGIQIYIVQCIHKNQLTSFDSAVSYLEQFYTRHENIDTIFRKHFSISDSNFIVQFVDFHHVGVDVEANMSGSTGYTQVITEPVIDNIDDQTS